MKHLELLKRRIGLCVLVPFDEGPFPEMVHYGPYYLPLYTFSLLPKDLTYILFNSSYSRCFSFAPELVSYLAPRYLHRRAAN